METRKRLIFHIDVNSAFLSWESVYRLSQDPDAQDLRLIPSAVGGDVSSRHGIILAKSTPAKKFGVVTAETIGSALRKCPELVIVPSRLTSIPAIPGRCSPCFLNTHRILKNSALMKPFLT